MQVNAYFQTEEICLKLIQKYGLSAEFQTELFRLKKCFDLYILSKLFLIANETSYDKITNSYIISNYIDPFGYWNRKI